MNSPLQQGACPCSVPESGRGPNVRQHDSYPAPVPLITVTDDSDSTDSVLSQQAERLPNGAVDQVLQTNSVEHLTLSLHFLVRYHILE